MNRKQPGGIRIALAVLAVFALTGPGCVLGPDQPVEPVGAGPVTMPDGLPGPFPVTKVIDGDTIWVSDDGQRVKVRLLGIDSPETHDGPECFGEEATGHALQALGGRQVYLETDPSQGTQDRYGRTLAYVWVDGGLFNLEQLDSGFAREYTFDQPYRYQAAFRAGEQAARADGRGLWNPEACDPSETG
ncbi:MAG: thermonuclease family protein [Actinomycetales bacterium]